jgi:hypothetical protein
MNLLARCSLPIGDHKLNEKRGLTPFLQWFCCPEIGEVIKHGDKILCSACTCLLHLSCKISVEQLHVAFVDIRNGPHR